MATTLADIASKAGVSQATVSRVINAKPGVSDDLRDTVMDAISALGMPLDRLQRNGTRLVAIITPDLSNPIFPEYVTSLTTLLAQQGFLAIICTCTPSGTNEDGFLSMLQNQPLAAAIFLCGRYDTKGSGLSVYGSLSERNIPTAFLNGGVREMNGLYTGTDDATAMTIALRHLRDLGHRRIGLLLGDRNHNPSILKYNAADQFFLDEHIQHDKDLTAWTTYGVESGQMAARALIERGATAIACASDQLALGAVKATRSLGLSIPRDVSVTGYDDSPAMGYMSPSLTTVRQPVDKICQSTITALMAMMENKRLAARRDVLLFEPELIVRESTGRCTER
ncbi:MAG: LacI family DNA-binding transcriptional regulator [Bifidobacterium psychraerophilum]|uniref:LacI family DNA-binding transcriptional regulator n=1 Tax=Bifidobacterium psychraerophilum TaxID=218140 RepID=UPI0039E94712